MYGPSTIDTNNTNIIATTKIIALFTLTTSFFKVKLLAAAYIIIAIVIKVSFTT
jgi:hypothetical protein